MERGGVQPLGQCQCIGHLVGIVTGHGGVDLIGHTHGAQVFHACQRLVESTLAAEDIVGRSVCAVKADADATDAGVLDFLGHVAVDERAVGGKRHD